MSMRFRWLLGALLGLMVCLSLGCGNASRNISSINNLYVASPGSSQIWGFRANFFTGALTLINGAPFPAAGAQLIAMDPSKNFAYVSTTGGNLEIFSVDANGSFAPSTQSPLNLNGSATVLTLDATGKYLLAATSSSIFVFSVANGSLTQVGNPVQVTNPFGSLPALPAAIAEQTPLNLLYVADQNNSSLLVFSFDPNSGSLAPSPTLPPIAVGLAPSAITIDSTGRYMYVANRDSSNVSAFTITPSNQSNPGTLQPITGSPFAVGAGGGPIAASVDPSGHFLYVLDHDTNQIFAFR